MKRRITLLLISILSFTVCLAQEDNYKIEKKYKKVETETQTDINKQKRKNKTFDETETLEYGTEYDNWGKRPTSKKSATVVTANNSSNDWKNNYINLGGVNTRMSQNGSKDLKSYGGASFTIGHTFYLHKIPVGGILRFGIDATWFDLNYTNYRIKHITYWETDNYQYHQGEVSMHIGPSVTIKPVENLNIHAYFRYAPSFSVLYTDDTLCGNYATFFVGGASISYGIIGLGIETRFGDCEYKELWSNSEEAVAPSKISHNGWKAYITFRF